MRVDPRELLEDVAIKTTNRLLDKNVTMRKDIERILELAWDLQCGISWYDIRHTKKELAHLRWKYQVEPFDLEDADYHSSASSPIYTVNTEETEK